jgi:hypothetical protein
MDEAGVQVTRRYTDEHYLLEMMKAARRCMGIWADVLAKRSGDVPDDVLDALGPVLGQLEAALLWCESDGLGPVALSGQGQLELEHDVPERG